MATTKARHDDGWVKQGMDAVRPGDSAVAIRHHLETLILKLAEAQAGSLDAVRHSRRHAEAVLALLDGRVAACEHARLSGIEERADRWACAGCGASWPKSRAASSVLPAPVRMRPAIHDAEPVATVPDPLEPGAPVNSL